MFSPSQQANIPFEGMEEQQEIQEHYDLPPMNMTEYKQKRDSCRQKIASKYDILGFISSGTYGRVYKAKSKLKYVFSGYMLL